MSCESELNKKINYTEIKNFDYADYRVAWEKALKAEISTTFPLHLDIELTSECNLRCKMCWQFKDPNAFPKGMMKFDLFKKIIDEGVQNGLCAIKLQSRGEAMMHPKIFEFSKYAKSKGIKDIHLTTNGTLFMKPKKFEKFFESGIDKLIFSIDSAHDESIEEIYKTKKPNIREYFKKIGQIKKEKKLNKPYLVVQTFAERSQRDKVYENLRKEFEYANHININTLFESNPNKSSADMLSNDFEYLPCSYLWTRLLVYWDGTTTTCCRDYEGKHLFLGNAKEIPLKEMWYSNKLFNLRNMHMSGKREKIKICANCDVSTKLKN